jgi:hypothetical protein
MVYPNFYKILAQYPNNSLHESIKFFGKVNKLT